MKKRTLLATALTALVLSVGVVQPAPVGETAEPATPIQAGALPTVEAPAAPQWGWVWGWEGNESMAWGLISAVVCASFVGPGAFFCSVAGVA